MRHQLGTLEHHETVVECVALISLRETAGDHAWNPLELQRSCSLFATGAGAKVKSSDDDVAALIERIEVWIVIFECYRGHLLRRHVVAIRVFTSVNAVGVQIVFVDEENAT